MAASGLTGTGAVRLGQGGLHSLRQVEKLAGVSPPSVERAARSVDALVMRPTMGRRSETVDSEIIRIKSWGRAIKAPMGAHRESA
eukprot:7210429-Pyramimonas_sp.AAC.1